MLMLARQEETKHKTALIMMVTLDSADNREAAVSCHAGLCSALTRGSSHTESLSDTAPARLSQRHRQDLLGNHNRDSQAAERFVVISCQ